MVGLRNRNVDTRDLIQQDVLDRDSTRPLVQSLREQNIQSKKEDEHREMSMSDFIRRQPVWLLLAAASGMCAAFNGVFAKL